MLNPGGWEALRLDTPPHLVVGPRISRICLCTPSVSSLQAGGTPGQVSALLIGETKPEGRLGCGRLGRGGGGGGGGGGAGGGKGRNREEWGGGS